MSETERRSGGGIRPAPETPLVSCIMPTCDRRAFVPLALTYFERQTYPRRELIVVDDGADPVEDLVAAWRERNAGRADEATVRYIRLPRRRTVGAKRNIACEAAAGGIILHWDDDDWHAPHRIAYQAGALVAAGADLCGLQTALFLDAAGRRAWIYENRARTPAGGPYWLSGSTLGYTKALWAARPFPDQDVGEDNRFVQGAPTRKWLVLEDHTFHVGMIHARNVSPKRTSGSLWRPCDLRTIEAILGDDWALYKDGGPGGAAADKTPPGGKPPASRRRATGPAPARREGATTNMADPCIARNEHLARREFAAFNWGQNLPHMRRWELPWALYAARLGDTMSVLDCTINPAGFEERIAALYPHVLYRHWNPVQGGAFAPPRGFPDGAFDRVFCINTLEHLLKEQRAALVRSLAAKLKPGGLLVFTSDYYFDSMWRQAGLIRAGVIRADRGEVFNGWNKVTPGEWAALGAAAGLEPLLIPQGEPEEGDASLYLNAGAAAHAAYGGVFRKPGGEPAPGAGRNTKVCLSLLTWNTRDVSLDSVRAHLEEARMLRRLGVEPFLCVCDNGSEDGTAQALRSMEAEIDVEHRFILNEENRGNSIARNQIIDAALAAGCDYILFMDGDIEVVPFSSFAMLRAMQTYGGELGCLGADSVGQTPARAKATPYLYTLRGFRTEETDLVAWTQYGLFRREVFDAGVRFDESGPFAGAGWGFEDNDLAFQMRRAGFLNIRFFGMTYLHRAAHSSLGIMKRLGIDPEDRYERRRAYLVEKWSGVEPIARGPLELVRRVRMPRVG